MKKSTIISSIAGVVLIFAILWSSSLKNKVSEFQLDNNNVILNNETDVEADVRVFINNENKVESIKLEEYLKGVVSCEMPAEFNIEALKAQAVAARTYAVVHMGAYGGRQYDKKAGIDLTNTVECQVYMNKEDRLNLWPQDKRNEYWAKICEAVESTRGEVIKYDGELITNPFYFSTSSGNTENSEDVFSTALPYLRSVSSPEDNNAPKHESILKISNAKFAEKINSKYKKAIIKTSNLKNQISILSRSESGSIKKIKVGNVTMTGQQFRNALGLNSANVTIDYGFKSIELKCRGYGHGVGMSQWGANFMGRCGKSHIEILKHYYQGVSIEKLKYAEK